MSVTINGYNFQNNDIGNLALACMAGAAPIVQYQIFPRSAFSPGQDVFDISALVGKRLLSAVVIDSLDRSMNPDAELQQATAGTNVPERLFLEGIVRGQQSPLFIQFRPVNPYIGYLINAGSTCDRIVVFYND